MTPHPNDPKGAVGATKNPLHLIPTVAMTAEAAALRHGAEKYGENNWRKSGVNAMTYVGAILRHLTSWRDGEDRDPDSGISHLGLIRANCAILLDAEHVGKLVDDRPTVPNPAYTDAPKGEIRAAIVDGAYKVWLEEDIPCYLPPAPPTPVGYSGWVYRGTGYSSKEDIMFACCSCNYNMWEATRFGTPSGIGHYHYIEAVK